MNATSEKFLQVLEDGLADQMQLAAEDLAAAVDLEADQLISGLCDADDQGELVTVFFCEANDDEAEFVVTRQCGDDGHRLLSFSGPYLSLAEAQRLSGPIGARWRDIA